MDSSVEQAPSWQTMPREIRYLIYEIVLDSNNNPPSTPNRAGERREITGTRNPRRSFFCLSDPLQPASSALLRCCRETNIELSDLIASRKVLGTKNPFSYHLDCIIRDSQAWPTWVRLPCAGRHMPNLKIDLRMFENRQLIWDINTVDVFLTLVQLLNHLVHHGPHFFHEGWEQHSMTVGTLHLEIMFTDEIGSTSWKNTSQEKYMAGNIEGHLRNPELHGLLFGHIGKIVCCSNSYDHEKIIEIQEHKSDITSLDWKLWRSFGFSWGPNSPVRKVQHSSAMLYTTNRM